MATRDTTGIDSASDAGPHALGSYVREHREAAGLSIRALSERVRVHFSFLARLESGEYSQPAPEILQRLARELQVEPADLFALCGYEIPENLPMFPAYLRSKYDMDPGAAAKLVEYFELLSERYGIREKQEPVKPVEDVSDVPDVESSEFGAADLDRFRR